MTEQSPCKKKYETHLRVRVFCPHCNHQATIRSSKDLSPLSRELYFQCTNFECGHTWRSLLSIVNTIVPSQKPRSNIYIPLADRTQQAAPVPMPTG